MTPVRTAGKAMEWEQWKAAAPYWWDGPASLGDGEEGPSLAAPEGASWLGAVRLLTGAVLHEDVSAFTLKAEVVTGRKRTLCATCDDRSLVTSFADLCWGNGPDESSSPWTVSADVVDSHGHAFCLSVPGSSPYRVVARCPPNSREAAKAALRHSLAKAERERLRAQEARRKREWRPC